MGDSPEGQRYEKAKRIETLMHDVAQRRLAGEDVSDDSVILQHPELMPELEAELHLATILNSGDSTHAVGYR